MAQCGANTSRIDAFMGRVNQGQPVLEVLASKGVPNAAQAFVRTTWHIIESGPTHSIAAAFTLGREDLIPNMFRALVVDLDKSFPGQWHGLRYYLERHIQLDEEHHAPMALQMLTDLCGHDQENWREAEESARAALIARIALWDGVLEELKSHQKQSLTSTHR